MATDVKVADGDKVRVKDGEVQVVRENDGEELIVSRWDVDADVTVDGQPVRVNSPVVE